MQIARLRFNIHTRRPPCQKIILPIWHVVIVVRTRKYVIAYSVTLLHVRQKRCIVCIPTYRVFRILSHKNNDDNTENVYAISTVFVVWNFDQSVYRPFYDKIPISRRVEATVYTKHAWYRNSKKKHYILFVVTFSIVYKRFYFIIIKNVKQLLSLLSLYNVCI